MKSVADYRDKPFESIGAMLRHSVAVYGSNISHKVRSGNGYQSYLYTDLLAKVYEYACWLHSLGLRRGDKLVILGESSFEWALIDWGAQTLGIVVVPIYPTLPADQAQYIAHNCEAKIALCASAEHAAKLPDHETHIFLSAGEKDALLSGTDSLSEDDWHRSIDETNPDDLATIIYTSGTTGQPKGAMLSHRAFVSLSKGIAETLPIHEDTFLSFLPLSHVYERYAGHILPIATGSMIVYAKSLATLAADMIAAEPTIMLCVPRFLENVRAKILDGVAKQSPLKQKLFNLALASGKKRSQGKFSLLHPILDHLVGKKIREKTGGKIKFFVSGGAALAPHVTEFYQAFNLMVLQGYGLTETTAASALNIPEDNDPETVGPPIKGVEIKIAPDGEILIRGDSVMEGYYKLPEDTAQAIDKDGWFHSGDIGEFKGNKLKITDRKKDILVLANGKNVAPQPIENRLKEQATIAEAVIFGDGMESCAALIVPDFDRLQTELPDLKFPANPEEVIGLEEIKARVKADVQAANKALADFEKVKKHVLLPRAFSVEEGELTPSLKVKKRVVKERYADEIKSMQRDKS